MSEFTFSLLNTDGEARLGRIDTPRGEIRTHGIHAGRHGRDRQGALSRTGARGRCGYHFGEHLSLDVAAGAERVDRLGGLHKFIGWDRPILTDSGGFQVMSLAKLRKITETGVTFQSHIDGSKHELTPERSMEIQRLLGSTIQMQLDECVAFPHTDAEAERAMQLSLRWAERSKVAFGDQPGHACFGIVQGGILPRLRGASATGLKDVGFHGYAIGGLAVGEGQELMLKTIECTAPHLPADRPRYLMGVGTPDDIVQSVARGVDMFDCVMPTRSGRHGQAFTRFGKFNLRNARFAEDLRPLDETSSHPALSQYSRAYLHHLVRAGELLGSMVLSWANIAYYQELMAGIRLAIAEDRYVDFVSGVQEGWRAGDSG